jgi:transposase-like protein
VSEDARNEMKTRRQFSAEFKAKAALEALKGLRTLNEIAGDLEIHPIQLSAWKRAAIEGMPQVFSNGKQKSATENEALVSALYQEIGQLKMELDWMKKKSGVLSARPPRTR